MKVFVVAVDVTVTFLVFRMRICKRSVELIVLMIIVKSNNMINFLEINRLIFPLKYQQVGNTKCDMVIPIRALTGIKLELVRKCNEKMRISEKLVIKSLLFFALVSYSD